MHCIVTQLAIPQSKKVIVVHFTVIDQKVI